MNITPTPPLATKSFIIIGLKHPLTINLKQKKKNLSKENNPCTILRKKTINNIVKPKMFVNFTRCIWRAFETFEIHTITVRIL